MTISGGEASGFNAIRLDDFTYANKGTLVSADTETGLVIWKDVTGADCQITLGPHAIRIAKREPR